MEQYILVAQQFKVSEWRKKPSNMQSMTTDQYSAIIHFCIEQCHCTEELGI